MTEVPSMALSERLSKLMDHLGIEQAHFIAHVPGDWSEAAVELRDKMISLTLVCPPSVDWPSFQSISERSLVIVGDQGRSVAIAARHRTDFPDAELVTLADYLPLSWDDIAAERKEELASPILNFLSRMEGRRQSNPVNIPEGSGEVSGILYSVMGSGPPLFLFPLGIASSQWTALLPVLQEKYTTIVLGGAHVGLVARLEERSRSGYLPMVNRLIDNLQIQPGESILDMGCGSGPYARLLARRTQGAKNRIVAADVSPYLLSEAEAITKNAGLDSAVEFRQADALDLPFPDASFDIVMSCTVLEEGNADKMFSELMRVTKSGGRLGIIVRAMDMQGVFNVSLPPETKRKAESTLGGVLSEGGCADSSIYSKFANSGFKNLKMYPYLAVFDSNAPLTLQNFAASASSGLTLDELKQFESAVAIAKSEGTFFLAQPLHCAVGTKP